jgi:hypothetical protein
MFLRPLAKKNIKLLDLARSFVFQKSFLEVMNIKEIKNTLAHTTVLIALESGIFIG